MEQESLSVWNDGIGDFIADMSEDDWKARYRDNDRGGDSSLSFVQSPAVGELVRFVLRSDVELDYADVLVEEKVEDVIKRFGLAPKLSAQESKDLRDTLLLIGARNQTREILRLVPDVNSGFSTSFVVPLGRREEEEFVRYSELFTKVFSAAARKRRLNQKPYAPELMVRFCPTRLKPVGEGSYHIVITDPVKGAGDGVVV